MFPLNNILTFLQSHSLAPAALEAWQAASGTDHLVYGIRLPDLRAFLDTWAKKNASLTWEAWLAVVEALYHGLSCEEKMSAGILLALYPKYRRQLSLDRLYHWLGELHGWKEIDYTCQSVFTADDLFSDWAAWAAFLRRLAADEHISRRRAALVLLVKPIRDNPDERLLKIALENIATLQAERDILITKAVSWLLRETSKHHAAAVQDYIGIHATNLPKATLREVQNKVLTGKKNG